VGMSFTAKKITLRNTSNKKDVNERVLNEENFLQQFAARVVTKESMNMWIFCNVCQVN